MESSQLENCNILFNRKVLFLMCVSHLDCSVCFSNSTVCHSHADIPWNPSALLQQNIPISRKQILAVYNVFQNNDQMLLYKYYSLLNNKY